VRVAISVNGASLLGEGSQADIVESVNRARHAFRNFVERDDDGLVLKGNSYVEYYRNGRMALLLHCKLPIPFKFPLVRSIGKEVFVDNEDLFVVLKADVRKPHHVEYWNEQLMLVPDIHIVQGPEGVIPSLVGLYDIHEEGRGGAECRASAGGDNNCK
jgi:hypothetical protein